MARNWALSGVASFGAALVVGCATNNSYPIDQAKSVAATQSSVVGPLDAAYLELVTRARRACPRLVIEGELLASSGRALVTVVASRFNASLRIEFAQVTMKADAGQVLVAVRHLSEFGSFPAAVEAWASGRDAPCPSGSV